jgi:hypothetical protein
MLQFNLQLKLLGCVQETLECGVRVLLLLEEVAVTEQSSKLDEVVHHIDGVESPWPVDQL